MELNHASNFVMGFLSCQQDGTRGFFGALLITDGRMRPLEFTYVPPVKPTVMQKVLYGKTLEEAIVVDVIARKLLEGAKKAPNLLAVDAAVLLGARELVACPVAQLSPLAEAAEGSGVAAVRYQSASPQDEQAVTEIVRGLDPSLDLLEPFARIREALKEAAKAPTTAPTTQAK